MASSNGWTSLFESFRLPTQPSPLTSAVDEEDSFVILRTERHTNKIYEINKDNINCDDEKERNDTTNEDKAMMEQVFSIKLIYNKVVFLLLIKKLYVRINLYVL